MLAPLPAPTLLTPAVLAAAMLAQAPPGTGSIEPAPPAPPTQVAALAGVPAASPAADDAQDVVVRGRSRRGDPAEPLNARSFAAAQAVDRILLGPVATAYGRKSPGPLRDGIRNFLSNLREPVVFANYLLQLKPGKAAETAGRFALNTTAGAAGLFDVARRKPFGLPRRRNSFGNTLGYWGVGPGPFFFLPLVGATSLRDFGGTLVDHLLLPGLPIGPLRSAPVRIPLRALNILDRRVEFDGALRCLRAADDPYAATRAFYLARRRDEIAELHGRPGPAAIPPGPRVVPGAAEVAASVGCPESQTPPAVPPAAPSPTQVPAPTSPPSPAGGR